MEDIGGYAWETGQSKQVVYISALDGQLGHIHELFVVEGSGWGHADLTEITGAPTAFIVVNGYGWETGKSKQVVYVTTDGHIHELFVVEGSGWGHADLTETTGAPVGVVAGGLGFNYVANGYSWEAGKSKQIVYQTDNHHIHELFVVEGSGWGHADLTEITGAPVGTAGGAVNGYSWEAGKSKQVVYVTTDGHIHELFVVEGSGWGHADLTETTGAPLFTGGFI